MATQVQFRRGTTSQNNAFTGAQGELTIDTDVYTIRIHDGTTAGGRQVPTLTATQTFTNKTMSTSSVWNGNAIGLGYGGTGAALTGVAGAIVYTTGSAMALSLAGTSGQVLTSGGTSGPTWVSASALSTGTATTATTATNIAGGSAGYLVYQQDTNTTGFITPGTSGFVLRSTGASTPPGWVSSTVTLGTTATQVGDTSTSIAGVTSITMGNGSYGGATVASVSGTGPWTATLTGISSTTGIMVGQNITATAGTGTLFGGSPTSVLVASIVSGTSITVTVTGGTIPTVGTITSLTTFGFLQVPSGTTAQRPYVPAVGMVRYNSTISSFEGYASGAWSSLGGVKSVDGYTYIQAETSAGASNGDLDFYAENSGGNGATQVGQWNRTNLKDYTGTLVGTQTTQNVFNATATTVNAFGAATAITLGNGTSATLTVNPGTVVGSNTTQAIFNTTATTVNAFGASTATTVGATTGTHTIRNATVTLSNATALNINGSSPAIVSSSTTASVFNTTTTTLNIGGAATTVSLGASSGNTTVNNNLVVTGNLTINGTTTTINATSLAIDDNIIRLAEGNAANIVDIGFVGNYTSGSAFHTGLVKQASSSKWLLLSGIAEPTNTLSLTGAVYDWLKLGTVEVTTGIAVNGSSSGTTTVVATAAAGTTTLTLPAATDTLVGKATTDTLTNKSIDLTNNTLTATSAQLRTALTDETGTGVAVFGTAPTISLPVIDNIKMGYTTTATAAGTTTLTASSNYRQFFTGTTTQTVVLPVTSTLVTGIAWEIENNSTGLLTVNSSGGNLVGTIPAGVCAHFVCIGTTLTTAADWDIDYISTTTITGTGANVLANNPTVAGITSTSGITVTSANPFIYTATTLASNVTVPSGYNALVVGPITINNGITITVPDGSTLTIV